MEAETEWNKIKHSWIRRIFLRIQILGKGRETSSEIMIIIFSPWTHHEALEYSDLSETKIGTQTLKQI